MLEVNFIVLKLKLEYIILKFEYIKYDINIS